MLLENTGDSSYSCGHVPSTKFCVTAQVFFPFFLFVSFFFIDGFKLFLLKEGQKLPLSNVSVFFLML